MTEDHRPKCGNLESCGGKKWTRTYTFRLNRRPFRLNWQTNKQQQQTNSFISPIGLHIGRIYKWQEPLFSAGQNGKVESKPSCCCLFQNNFEYLHFSLAVQEVGYTRWYLCLASHRSSPLHLSSLSRSQLQSLIQ